MKLKTQYSQLWLTSDQLIRLMNRIKDSPYVSYNIYSRQKLNRDHKIDTRDYTRMRLWATHWEVVSGSLVISAACIVCSCANLPISVALNVTLLQYVSVLLVYTELEKQTYRTPWVWSQPLRYPQVLRPPGRRSSSHPSPLLERWLGSCQFPWWHGLLTVYLYQGRHLWMTWKLHASVCLQTPMREKQTVREGETQIRPEHKLMVVWESRSWTPSLQMNWSPQPKYFLWVLTKNLVFLPIYKKQIFPEK